MSSSICAPQLPRRWEVGLRTARSLMEWLGSVHCSFDRRTPHLPAYLQCAIRRRARNDDILDLEELLPSLTYVRASHGQRPVRLGETFATSAAEMVLRLSAREEVTGNRCGGDDVLEVARELQPSPCDADELVLSTGDGFFRLPITRGERFFLQATCSAACKILGSNEWRGAVMQGKMFPDWNMDDRWLAFMESLESSPTFRAAALAFNDAGYESQLVDLFDGWPATSSALEAELDMEFSLIGPEQLVTRPFGEGLAKDTETGDLVVKLPLPALPGPVPDVKHSDDFASVLWFGTRYRFTKLQAACVKLMWENWARGTPELLQQTILEAAEACGDRLQNVFDKGKHPAWGAMITSPAKGIFRLSEPEQQNRT